MKRVSHLLGIATLLFAIFLPATAQAAPNSSGLSITPRKDMIIKPGDTVTDKLTIGNLNSQSDLQITFKPIDFTFTDSSGTPKLLLSGQDPTPWSLKPFIKLPQSIIIPAGQSKSVDYSITIPKNQGAGSYYSAIEYRTGGGSGGNVNLAASGVTLVFVSVPGVVHEDMTLKRIGAYQYSNDKVTGKFISIATNTPQQIGYTLQNNGNVAESPAGSITVSYMFGGKKWNITNINEKSNLALIGQPRLFTPCFETGDKYVKLNGQITSSKVCKTPHLWPGRYTVALDAFYGQNGNTTHEVTGTGSFWYLPWWFVIAFIAVLGLIAFAIWKISRKLHVAVNGRSPAKRRKR